MSQLSHYETSRLHATADGQMDELFRNCTLAVLNSGSKIDNSQVMLKTYKDYSIEIISKERGISLKLYNPPEHAFANGQIIKGIAQHLFSVVRDLVYISSVENTWLNCGDKSGDDSEYITNWIFYILRNAGAFTSGVEPNIVVCWGGHSISESELEYTKLVGKEIGLRKLNICTGCGPGAMEGPMRGACVGHTMQRFEAGRFIGITEPSIISSEPPNPMVKELIIMPDIEKRLEAFVRFGHAFVIFPGGPGTIEELMFILGLKTDHANDDQPIPLVLTGPKGCEPYFEALDEFIRNALGNSAARQYDIVIGDPKKVADICVDGMKQVKDRRINLSDSFRYNWKLKINPILQEHFDATHENMRNLKLTQDQPLSDLISNLRRAFSGIVAGNVKPDGIQRIKENGPFEIKGDELIMSHVDKLLRSFVEQGRMQISKEYVPCYKLL